MKRIAVLMVALVATLALCGAYKPKLGGAGAMARYGGAMSRSAATMATVDTVTMLWAMEETLVDGEWDAGDHPNAAWPSAAPDSLYEDTDGTVLFGFQASRGAPTQAPGLYNASVMRQRAVPEANWPATTSQQYLTGIYVDLSDIPVNSEILEANIGLMNPQSGNIDLTGGEAMWAVLDTVAADVDWISSALYEPSGNISRLRDVSWNNTDQTNATAWSPALDDRDAMKDFGPTSEPWDETVLPGGTFALDVRRAVQYHLDYGTSYAGFLIFIDASPVAYEEMYWSRKDIADGTKQPFIFIKYRTRDNQKAWGNDAFAFNFQTDDQDTANYSYSEIMEARGYNYTLFVRGDAIDGYNGYSSDRKLSVAELQDFMNAGHEIAHHTLDHLDPDDNANFDYYGLGNIISSTADDSLETEIERDFLVEVLGISAADSASVIRTFAYPGGGFGAEAVEELATFGFLGGRVAGGSTGIGTQGPPRFAAGGAYEATQETDGAMRLSVGDTINMFVLHNGYGIDEITLGSAATTEAEIIDAMEDFVTASWRSNQSLMGLFAHGYPGGVYGSSVCTDQQLKWILDYLEGRGDTRIGTFAELLAFWRSQAVATEAPSWAAGYTAQASAQNQIFWYREK